MTMLSAGTAGLDGPFGWVSDVPEHGRFDPYDGTDPYDGAGVGSGGDEAPDGHRFAGDRAGGDPGGGGWAGADEEPPEPKWALDTSAAALRERLAAAVRAPAGVDAAAVIETLSAALSGAAGAGRAGRGGPGPVVDAAGLVDGIRVVQRLVNHYQAVQQQWIAALARPGVGVPLDQVVELCRHPGRTVPGALRPPDRLPDDLPRGRGGDVDLRPLLDHPAWRAPLADTAARLASAEVGCALRLSPSTARDRVEKALAVIDRLPATYAAQYAGDLDGYRASIITDRTDVLPGPQRARVERRVLPGAELRTPSALRDQVDRAVIAADPDAAARRAERARAGRGVRLGTAQDDMAEFRAMVGCTDGHLAFGVLDEQATALMAAGLADGRGASQLRADVFCDLFRTLAETGHAHLTGTTPAREPADTAREGSTTPDSTQRHPTPTTGWAEGHDGNTCGSTGGSTGGSTDGKTGRGSGDHGTAGRAEEHQHPTTGRAAGHDGGPVTTGGDRFSGVQPCRGHGTDTGGGRDGSAGKVAARRRGTALNVYIDVTTLAGLDDRAGELAGYGTITAATARALAASADTVRALIVRPITADTSTLGIATWGAGTADDHPPPGAQPSPARGHAPDPRHASDPARSRTCGTILDAGRAVYRPPAAVLDYVTARDRTCCWPGCRAPGWRCDADHRHAFRDGGATCACNLDVLCRWHHRVKTFSAWRAEPGPDGALVWISPTGHRYPTEPGHPLRDPVRDGEPPGIAAAIADPGARPRTDLVVGPPPF